MTPGLATVLALGMMLGLGACTDGYPIHDDPLSNPMALSQTERIQAMNDLGRRAHPDQRWRYDLAPPCTLEVDARPRGGERRLSAARLAIKDVRVRHDAAGSSYQVELRRRAADGKSTLPVLESATRLDALLMSGLLHAVQASCREARP